MSAAAEEFDVESQVRESRKRAVEHARKWQLELERMQLLEYAVATQDDPKLRKAMQEVAEHLASGQQFEGTTTAEDFVKRNRAKRGL